MGRGRVSNGIDANANIGVRRNFCLLFYFFFFSFPLSSKNVRWKLDEGLIFEGEKIESEKMERSFFVRNDRETGTVDDRLRGSADDNVLVTSVTSC